MILCLLVLFLTVLALYRSFKKCAFDNIPGPAGIFIFENALDFLMDPVDTFNYINLLAERYKDLYKIKFGPKKYIVIYNPKDVEVVISGSKHIEKGFLYRFIKPLVGNGILLSQGEKWRIRRKLLCSSLHFNILQSFSSIIQESTRCLAEKLLPELNNSKTSVLPYFSELSLKSVCETTMGVKLNLKASVSESSYKQAIKNLGSCFVYRAQRIWMYPDIIHQYTDVGRKQKELLNSVAHFRDQVINEKRKLICEQKPTLDSNKLDDELYMSAKKKIAMLDLLLEAEKEGAIDVKGIEEEVDNLIFAGLETTSTALQYIFMLLANNKDAQDKLVEECREVLGYVDQNITTADLARLKYTECCIKEAMRLFPPVGFITRNVKEDIVLSGYNIPAGTECVILIRAMHRRSDHFHDPLKFLPERFMVNGTWHPYAYLPFSAGPRNCLGQKFAMMEMKIVIATVLRQYVLKPVTKPQDVMVKMDFVLRSKHPIYVKFEKRL